MTATKQGVRKDSPFFSVKREKLYRKDRTDTRHDALYRKDDRSQLSVVSRDYKLITHRQVVDFVHHTLRDLDIKYKVNRSEIASNGAKMFHVIKFRGNSTALDAKKKDECIPTITVKNSYDKSTGCDIDYGGYRLVCSNGLVVGVSIEKIHVIHFGKEDVNEQFLVFRDKLVKGIVRTVEGLKVNFERLNHESGKSYFEKMLFLETFAKKYREEMVARMFPFVNVEYEKNEETGREEPAGFKLKQEFSAYLLYCILTEISTHKAATVLAKHRMERLIADQFEV